LDNKKYKDLNKKIEDKYQSDLNELKKEIITAKENAYKELEK
jgi:hypothetical protein|tara:strand:- start:1065 stop:1190 length:126 start_codon:yes stop_codon:yes gene_type:complete